MLALSSPLMAEAMDPIKKSCEWIHYSVPFHETKTTTTKKDGRIRVSMLYQQGNSKYGPKVIIKFTKLTMKPTKRLYLIVKSSLIYYFFLLFHFPLFFKLYISWFLLLLMENQLDIAFHSPKRWIRNDIFLFSIHFRTQVLVMTESHHFGIALVKFF